MESLGDRMKENYENIGRNYLVKKIPVIIRLDGKAFHTLTRDMDKPFDHDFIRAMQCTAEYLVHNIQGAKVAYVQSDEISILLTDYESIQTDAWFGYNKSKMESISASMATAFFNDCKCMTSRGMAFFDSRSFNIPKEEVSNYFLWRAKDWERNSLSMLCRSHFSDKELHEKNRQQQHEMLHQKGVNWADLPEFCKNGTFKTRDSTEYCILPNYESISNLISPYL